MPYKSLCAWLLACLHVCLLTCLLACLHSCLLTCLLACLLACLSWNLWLLEPKKIFLLSSSGSGPGPGWVKVRWGSGGSDLDELSNIFGFHHHHHLPAPQTFFLASEGSRHVRWTWDWLVWLKSCQNFQVESKAEIKLDYRGDIREYFNVQWV